MIAYFIVDIHFFWIDSMKSSGAKFPLIDEFVPRDHDGGPKAVFFDRLSGGSKKGKLTLQAHFVISPDVWFIATDLLSMLQVALLLIRIPATMA